MPKKDGWFHKGHAGGPGRPPGSRNKLSEDFIKDLHASWLSHGKQALLAMCTGKPADFCKMMAGLMPRDVLLKIKDNRPVIEYSTQELLDIIEAGPEEVLVPEITETEH